MQGKIIDRHVNWNLQLFKLLKSQLTSDYLIVMVVKADDL
jgi:hypothetical protein